MLKRKAVLEEQGSLASFVGLDWSKYPMACELTAASCTCNPQLTPCTSYRSSRVSWYHRSYDEARLLACELKAGALR